MEVKPQSALSAKAVGQAVYAAIRECATTMRSDCLAATKKALQRSSADGGNERAQAVLASLVENAEIAKREGVPLCQDTGSVWVCLEVGEENTIPATIFSEVDAAVARAYTDGRLRMSMVRNALFDRTNTTTNTPAFTEIHLVSGRAAKLHVMLKGGGSDNASRVCMLPPSAGVEGIKREVLACVREKAANACPPLLIGVGVGATFDKVASLAKSALLREIGSPAESDEAQAFEAELLAAVNDTNIGPGALGGSPTALAVHLKTAPCHIAALPLAINMGCTALRSKTIDLIDEEGREVFRAEHHPSEYPLDKQEVHHVSD